MARKLKRAAKAKTQSSPRNSAAGVSPEAFAKAYRDLEDSVCDMRNAAIVLEVLMQNIITAPDVAVPYKRFWLTQDEVDAVFFALYQSNKIARDLYKEYYAGFGEDSDGSPEVTS